MEKFTNISDIEKFKIITDLLLNHIVEDTTPPALNNVFSVSEISEIDEYFMCRLKHANTFSDVELGQVFNEFNQEQMAHIVPCVQRQKMPLTQSFIRVHNRKYGDTLKDYNWNLKTVMGTSLSSTLNYPVFQINMDLMMNLLGNNAYVTRNVVFEMESEELIKLIELLESEYVCSNLDLEM